MMMKVSELEGAELDYWVAKAEGHDVEREPSGTITAYGVSHDWIECWEPSTDWSQGGPIIERESIRLDRIPGTGKEWYAACVGSLGNHYAGTPLIAAMRAYIASKYGDEIEA